MTMTRRESFRDLVAGVFGMTMLFSTPEGLMAQNHEKAKALNLKITSLSDATPIMNDVRQQEKTGVLTVLSHESPPNIRWALQCFFLRGKLAKIEHTLETSTMLTSDGQLEILLDEVLMPSIDAQYTLNPPEHLFFFPLYEQTVLREMQERSPQVTDT